MFELAEVERTAEEIAALAGLRHVDRHAPGWRRHRCGRGFTFRDLDGDVLRGDDRARVESLAVPPAWTDVWICPSPDGHLQAAGVDDAGRWQYLYHPEFRQEAERVKYLRLGPFGFALEGLRRTVAKDLLQGRGTPRRMVAAVVRLIDVGLIRVGTDQPEDPDDAVGATTMLPECVSVALDEGRVELAYTGKGGREHCCTVEDAALAHAVADGLEVGADRVFACIDDGEIRTVSAEDVNRYLVEVTGQAFTAKDYRTWGGSVTVAEHLAGVGPPQEPGEAEATLLEAIDLAAERLGNTRAVARGSYVAPTVTEAYLDGRLDQIWRRTRSGKHVSRAERAVTRVYEALETSTLRAIA